MRDIIKKMRNEQVKKFIANKKDDEDQAKYLQDKIDDLQYQLDNVNESIADYNAKIKSLTETIPDNADEFEKLFTKVSKFCSKYDNRPVMKDINITCDSLEAIDGFRLIKVTCNIPQKLKNKRINAIARTNYTNYISKITEEFPNIPEIANKRVTSNQQEITKTASEWFKQIIEDSKPYEDSHMEERVGITFIISKTKISMNKYYILDLFDLFDENEPVTIMLTGFPTDILIFKTEKIFAGIMPIRPAKDSD